MSILSDISAGLTETMPGSDTTLSVVSTKILFNGIDKLQDMTPTICAEADPGTTAKLEDTRDGKIYVVRKLGDGNCWMIQNLALEGGQTLDSSKTNLAAGTTYALPASSDDKFSSLTTLDMYNGSHDDGNTESTGAYYNARVANTLTAGEAIIASRSYSYNICPKGWTLPTNSQQSSVTSYADDFGIAYPGRYYDGSLHSFGGRGDWWSRTASSDVRFHMIYASSGVITPSVNTINHGFPIRCLAKTDVVAPSKPTLDRTDYQTFTINSSDNSAVEGYYVKKDDGAFDNTGYQTSNTVTITQDGEHTYYVWAVDGEGNLSERVSISTYLVKNQQATNSTLSVRLGGADTSFPELALGSSKYALAGTPIYVSVSANQNYFTDYVCRSTTTTACTSSNMSDGTADYLLGATSYIFASSHPGTLGVISTMQQMNSTICSRTNIDDPNDVQNNLRDERDDHIYVVRKLGDGNCWMIQNLALFGGQTISSSLSNVSSNYTLPSSSAGAYSGLYTARMNNGSHKNGDKSSYGSYYSYMATSVGTGTSSVTSGDLQYNICSKNWTLPTYSQMMSVKSYASTFNIVYAGYYSDSGLLYTGTRGFWWSRTISKTDQAYFLRGLSSGLTVDSAWRYAGNQLRCLAK